MNPECKMREFNGVPKVWFGLSLKECEWPFNNSDPSVQLAQLRQWVRQNIGKLPGTAPCLKGRILAMLFMLAGAGSFPAAAHPHAWIDLRSTVVLNENGQVIGIEQQWLFDDFYTVFVVEGYDSGDDGQKRALTALAETNLKNLRAYNYFTEVQADNTKVPLGTVSEYESELRNGRLWMRFVVPFSTPIDASMKLLSFAVFDPTFYIEILHLKGDVIGFRGAWSEKCAGRIIPPNPTTEAFLLAQALDRDAKPDNTLGSIFAERVEVSCR